MPEGNGRKKIRGKVCKLGEKALPLHPIRTMFEFPMNGHRDITSARVFRQQDYWSGFHSPVDSGFVVLLG